MTSAPTLPADQVLAAFGLRPGSSVEPLPGGTGRSIKVGDLVLKPVDDAAEAEWSCGVLDAIEPDEFRVPRPRRSRDGTWVSGGWTAAEFLAGEAVRPPVQNRVWRELLTAGRAFHRALGGIPRPALLSSRRDRWAVADRVAWGDQVIEPLPETAHLLARLLAVRTTTQVDDDQLVHGDLSGNVLFSPGELPAIFDFSPYWRPPAYADAIVATDGLLWFGGGNSLVELAADDGRFPSLLARATIFRLMALDGWARQANPNCLDEEVRLFVPVVALVERLVEAAG